MSKHQHDANAVALWNYFQSVINWVKATFPKYRREMKGVAWGPLSDEFGTEPHDAKTLEKRIAELMADEDATKKSAIYRYVLDGDEHHLSIRAFSPNEKRAAYERQKGICVKCQKKFEIDEMEGDHVEPWREGGKTNAANCQMLCKDDNRRKSDQ